MSSWDHAFLVSRCDECPYVVPRYASGVRTPVGDCGFFLDSQMMNTMVKLKEAPPGLCPLREGPVTLSLMPGV